MATTNKKLDPTNENLVLPDYNEKADINVINSNFTKAADAVNTLNSNLANKADATEIASRFQHASGNATSYQFDAPGKGGSSYYKFGLVMFGINANDLGVYYVCIVDGTTLYSKPIIAPTNRTVTISLSDSKVTVTLNSTIYGGMSLLWVI